MFGLGVGHIRKMPLKFGPEARYVWLTQKKAERLDMSGLGPGHVREMPLEFGPEARYVWLTQEKTERPDMSGQSIWNPARG
jgi:hypothetical protein